MKRHNEKTLIMCYTLSKNSWNQFWQLGTWYQSNRSINLEKFCRKTHCFNLAWYSLDRVMQNFKLERFVYHSPNTSVCPTYRKWLIKSLNKQHGQPNSLEFQIKAHKEIRLSLSLHWDFAEMFFLTFTIGFLCCPTSNITTYVYVTKYTTISR